MLLKFPHIGKQFFEELSNENLINSKEVCRTWHDFITSEKFYKQRVYYETIQKKKDQYGLTAFHKAAEIGDLSEFKLIINNVEDKNPESNDGTTPFHFAASNGHLNLCKLILKNVSNKNPEDGAGITPLHEAAKNGHFLVCQLIINNITGVNILLTVPIRYHKTIIQFFLVNKYC